VPSALALVYDRYRSAVLSPDRWISSLAIGLLSLVVGVAWGAMVGTLGAVIAAALLVAAIGGVLMLRSTQWGFVVLLGVIALLPFGALPIGIGFSPTFLDLAMLVIFVVWVARVMTGRQREFVATPLALPVAVFLLVAVAAFVAGLSHSHPTLNAVRRFAELLLGVALFYVVVNSVHRRSDLEQIGVAVILLGTLEALVGISLYHIPSEWAIRILSALGRFNYPTGWGVLRFINDDPALPMRATSTSIDPNVLGGLMILVGVMTACQLVARKPILRRWLLVGCLGAVSLCLYLTYSRGSLAGLVAGLLLLGLLRYRGLLLLLVATGIIILLLPQSQPYIQYFVGGLRGLDRSTQMRLGEYKDALILIGRYPWIGVGFAGAPDIDLYIGVSSLYLLIAEQMGLLGLASFLLALGAGALYVVRVWRNMGPLSPYEPLLLAFVAALAGGLVAGMLDHYFFSYPHGVTLFWFFVGLAASSARLGEKDESVVCRPETAEVDCGANGSGISDLTKGV
jgi:hypothetical protein